MNKISHELSSLNEDLCSDFDSNYYLEMDKTESSVLLIGNTKGFIHLATHILELALASVDGKHYHFGEGALENCDEELEILYKNYKCE
jgi:hypothetical protein